MSVPKDPEQIKLWKENLSKANSGENNPMFGKKRPDVAEQNRQRIGEKNPGWKEKIHKNCPVCKEDFDVVPSKKHLKCCSRECNGKLRTKPKIHKVCPICGRDFEVKPSAVNQECCSYECKYKLKSKRYRGPTHPAWKERIYKICILCGEPFEVVTSQEDQQYCSNECRGKAYIKKYSGANSPQWKERIYKTCPACKIDFEVIPSVENQKYCSMECMIKLRDYSGPNNPAYIDGRSYEPYTPEFNNQLKAIIRHRDGYKCQKCGCPEIENNIRLSTHHIDYNKQNCKPFNLISLCNKCNSSVNSNRFYWTEYFTKRVKEIMKSPLQLHFNYEISKKEVVQSP